MALFLFLRMEAKRHPEEIQAARGKASGCHFISILTHKVFAGA
jgi:hypothetical protein